MFSRAPRRFYLVVALTLAALLVSWFAFGRQLLLRYFEKVEWLTLPELHYLLHEPTHATHEPSRDTRDIPRLLHLTYKDLSKIPSKVDDNLSQYAQGYDAHWYDDTRARDFLQTYFTPRVLRAFNKAKKGAHKADLLRYCLLYIHGGVYMDVKTVLIRPLDEIFNKPGVDTYFVHEYDNNTHLPQIYNGVIATYPRNPFFLQLIHNYVRLNPVVPEMYYMVFLRQMYNLLQVELSNRSISPGRHHSANMELYLFSQKCTQNPHECPGGLDRYGLCCYLYEGPEKIIKVRYSDFPWV